MATKSKKIEVEKVKEEAFTARSLLDKSLEVIKVEIFKLYEFSAKSSYVLDPESIKSLNDLTRTLVIMDKNSKTAPIDEEQDTLTRLSDDQLMALAKDIITDMKKEKEKKPKK